MKIIRVFGVVVGIHVFALMLILANPGCSSTVKPAPAPGDTVAKNEPAAGAKPTSPVSPLTPAPLGGDSPTTVAYNSSAATVRYSPTRPGTAAASALEIQPVTGVTPATTYTVVNGDNLSVVAKKHKLTVSELAAANNLKPAAMLAVGKKLIIPGKAAAPARNSATTSAGENGSAPAAASTAPAVAKTSGDAIPHTIKPGENLGAIAKKYGVKVGEIAVANNITDPKNIRSGQVLMIPGWQTPTAKTPKSASATTQARESSAAAISPKPAAAGTPPLLVPPPGQDLDAGLKLSPTSDVPVIKVEESPASPPKTF